MKRGRSGGGRSLPAGMTPATMRRIAVGWLAVLAFGLWHGTDVKAAVYATGDAWLSSGYLILAVAILAVTAMLGWRLLSGAGRGDGAAGAPWRPERIYPAAGLFLGLLFVFVLPPLSAPDEISHYVSAYQLSSRLMGKEATDRYGRVLLDAQDAWVEDIYGNYVYETTEEGIWKADAASSVQNTVLGETLTEDTYRFYHDLVTDSGFVPGQESELAGRPADSLYPPVVTTPLVYLPQALLM
ncbi:MAG: hypothetical protein LUC94_10220, partial [Clostridiales bacterium]|nr:hypothetical protein [Clostridiales bacterium]